MVQAGLATSAAPLYFPPISIDDDIFADGGVLSNCPVGESLAVVDAIFPRRNLELLVSLGCGTWISDEEKDAARGLTTEQQQRQARQARATGRGAGEWIATLANLQMDSSRIWTETLSRLNEGMHCAVGGGVLVVVVVAAAAFSLSLSLFLSLSLSPSFSHLFFYF